MDTNGTTGAYCVVSGDGHRFYGDTRQEAHDAMLASAAASARTLARFGEDFLPADVAEALPALPDGYEYLVLERKHLEPAGYDGGYGDDVVGIAGIDPTTVDSFPSGRGRADFLRETTYASGATVSTEKILVSNDGTIFDFANPGPATFEQAGNWNLEIVARSSFFQGRKIDVVIAPEILTQTKQGKTDPALINPG